MRFFTGSQSAQSSPKPPFVEADNIISNAGRIADEAILDCITESAAFWTAYRRRETRRLEKQLPGYREELNKQRALAGLPSL